MSTPSVSYTDTLPSHSDLPSIRKIVKYAYHPAWTTIESDHHILQFHHHGGQIPGDKPLTAATRSIGASLRIDYWNSTDDLKFYGSNTQSDLPITIPSNLDDIVEAIETEMAARHDYFESYRVGSYHDANHNRIPSKVRDRLQENYDTVYDFLTAPAADVLSIRGIGEARYESMLNTSPRRNRHHSGWCVYACCPTCNTDWYSIVQEIFEPEPHIIRELLYCPACHFDDIPADYRLDPEPFLNDRIITNDTVTLYV